MSSPADRFRRCFATLLVSGYHSGELWPVSRVLGPRPFLLQFKTSMADYTKYDPRVDSLVMESRTEWDPSVGTLSEDDKKFLAKMVHLHPAKAHKIAYFRSHTGFTREITVTADDVHRIYQEQLS